MPRWTSREFLLVIAVGAFALASALGWINPTKITQAAQNISSAGNALPALLDALTNLASANGPLLIFAGAVWAFVKRRSEQKLAEENKKLAEVQAQAEVEKINVTNRGLVLKRELLNTMSRSKEAQCGKGPSA